MNRRRILVADDDESLRWVTQVQLQRAGYEVLAAENGQAALELLRDTAVDLVITDLKMPGMSGLDLLRQVRLEFPETNVIVVTAYGTVETAVEAMKAGAFDYITKPVNPEELKLTAARALEHVALREEVRNLRASLDRKYGFENLLGRSPAWLQLLDMASRAARAHSTVLLRGETGTGKDLLARAIHRNSPRKDRPFVAINCGAIPRELIESELFGHVRGAFTGAVANRKGQAEMAEGGTLFLDEIGELPLELQVKLLRLVQQGEVAKLGASGATRVDVRIIAATNRNLQAMVEDGAFREDLYYRLSVIPLDLPPLRERPEDIPELVEHFFVQSREKNGRPNLVLPPCLLPHFTSYRWPGNVRELENVVERLVVLSPGDQITLEDLPDFLRRSRSTVEELRLDLPPQGISLEAVEKELILRALEKFNWNQSQAARYLDLSRKTLIYRMDKFKLRREGEDDAVES
jgi:DNA-binding NtrC family response regulator